MKYTHKDKDGMLWRFEGGRPVSKIADDVTAKVFGIYKKMSLKKIRKKAWLRKK